MEKQMEKQRQKHKQKQAKTKAETEAKAEASTETETHAQFEEKSDERHLHFCSAVKRKTTNDLPLEFVYFRLHFSRPELVIRER